jgi:anhydro-N-acetylmuramic acid kinase
LITVGLMSGTSLDGIDVALLEVREAGLDVAHWDLLAFESRAFSSDQRQAILEILKSGTPRDLALLHTSLGEWLAEATLALLEREGVATATVEVIGSHGQTVWHEPPTDEGRGFSLQLGCPATIAERTGISVVSDFRSRDLAAGGHGAPLVPWADRVFFSSGEGPRAIQNLGGMGNVTWLPKAGDPAPVVAFDTGPGVVLLDAAAALATGGRESFDRDGQLANLGRVSEPVLRKAMEDPFFDQPPPRSTGRERFGSGFLEGILADFQEIEGLTVEPGNPTQGWPDVLATLTALTARSIADSYRRWVLPLTVGEVFLTGGGCRNPTLADAISRELAPLKVAQGVELGMDPDAREAAAFALLAWAHVRGVPANVPKATGSEGPRVLGSWTPAGERGET